MAMSNSNYVHTRIPTVPVFKYKQNYNQQNFERLQVELRTNGHGKKKRKKQKERKSTLKRKLVFLESNIQNGNETKEVVSGSHQTKFR